MGRWLRSNSEFEVKADLVLLAMGFVSPAQQMLSAFGVEKDPRGNAKERSMVIRLITQMFLRFLLLEICAAASLWWYGQSVKGVSVHAQSMSF